VGKKRRKTISKTPEQSPLLSWYLLYGESTVSSSSKEPSSEDFAQSCLEATNGGVAHV
jgi:hypothetical protein